jgi:isoleucyl-tRNA synthetase
VGHAALQDIVRMTLLSYWNTAAFMTLYAVANDWLPYASPVPDVADRPALDRWAISELHRLVLEVTAALEAFETQRAGRLLAAYVDDLSNWYVRRSRRRFWNGDPAALATLHECVHVLTLLLAPIVPFITERIWQDVVRPVNSAQPSSVHLARWPRVDGALVDDALAEQVALVRRTVELGRAARAESRVRGRQPLGRALVGAPGWAALPDDLKREVAEELNVVSFEELAGELVDRSAKGNFRSLGKRFGKDTPKVAAAVAAADAAALAAALRDQGQATVLVDGAEVTLAPEDVLLTETTREGWAVVSASGETVALDLTITEELRRAGLAREVVRIVQEARKSAGFEVTDRVSLVWSADGETGAAIEAHLATICDEVLAVTAERGTPSTDRGWLTRDSDLGLAFSITRSAQ